LWASLNDWAIGQNRYHTPIIFQNHARATDVRRVLIVENQMLLGAGVHSLLGDETDLKIRGISPHDQNELIQDIGRFQPDIVIMDKVSQLIAPLNLLTALENHSQLQVIVVSADDNQVCIYDKRRLLVKQASDFLDMIRER
jgi:DNA-binding NarL/FixJ family response regulator